MGSFIFARLYAIQARKEERAKALDNEIDAAFERIQSKNENVIDLDYVAVVQALNSVQ